MIVRIPPTADRRKKTWRKHLVGVDTSRSNGYAFDGEWLRADERAELPVGALILGYDEPGSMKNRYPLVRVWRVDATADGGLAEVYRYEGAPGERSWALAVRDEIAALLAEADPEAGGPSVTVAGDTVTVRAADGTEVTVPLALVKDAIARTTTDGEEVA